MNVQRKSEITVGTATAEWSDEMLAQWNTLADTIARTVQQKSRDAEENGLQQGRATNLAELERTQTALAESDAKVTAVMRESAARLDAMQREYEQKVVSLQQELGQRNPGQPLQYQSVGQAEGTAITDSTSDAWEAEPSIASKWRTSMDEGRKTLWTQGAELRSRPYFMPVVGFLGGLLLMASLYPLLHRGSALPVAAAAGAKQTAGVATAEKAARTVGADRPVQAAGTQSTPASSADASAVRADSVPAPIEGAISEKFAVLLAGGKTLTANAPGSPSAAYEAHLAMHAGYAATALYQRNGRYMAAVLFSSKEEAQEGLKTINAPYDGRWKRTSSVVALDDWCPVKQAANRVVVNGAEITVWSCGKNPS